MFNQTTISLIQLALEEDIGSGDITSAAVIPAETFGSAVMLAQEPLRVCGQEAAALVFSQVDERIRYAVRAADGTDVEPGAIIAEVSGPLRALLGGERTALNFLQRLCAIATATARVSRAAGSKNVRILDTRKTTPGWRELEKYAVRTGGGSNHRFGLYDAVLIKNNHVDAVGGDVALTVRLCRERCAPGTKIEVEVRNMAELDAALSASPDAILLDNMPPDQLQCAVERARAACGEGLELEASGGIDERTLPYYAATGVNSVSLGALTHSVQAVAIAFRYCAERSR